jgi:hypothetical protein
MQPFFDYMYAQPNGGKASASNNFDNPDKNRVTACCPELSQH